MKSLHMIAWVLVMIGGINWLLIGIGGFVGSDWNVVHLILGSWPALEWLVYVIVGVATVYEIVNHKRNCAACAVTKTISVPASTM